MEPAGNAWVKSISIASAYFPKVLLLIVGIYLVFFYIYLLFNNW